MNVDELARRAGRDLRELERFDVEEGLDQLQRVVIHRRRVHATLAVSAVACVVLVVLAATWLHVRDTRQSTDPVGQPTGAPSDGPPTSANDCGLRVSCLGGRTYTVALDAPVTWTLPRGFEAPYSGSPSRDSVETYYRGGRAGVTVLEHVRAATASATPRAVPGVGTAEELANWIANRPFLSSSSITSGELDGHRTWSVDVEVPRGVPEGPATCNARLACYPVLFQADRTSFWTAGAWPDITSRYTVLDQPGAGITVVWSWSNEGKIPPVVDEVVDSIGFDG